MIQQTIDWGRVLYLALASRLHGFGARLPKWGPMREMARLALQSCEVAAATAGITLHLEAESGLPPVPVDRDRINQVFDNLLGNAIKFSPRGGAITVKVQDAGGMILMSVLDTGVGIPADKSRQSI